MIPYLLMKFLSPVPVDIRAISLVKFSKTEPHTISRIGLSTRRHVACPPIEEYSQ